MAHIESSLIFLSDYILYHVIYLNRKKQLISRFPYFQIHSSLSKRIILAV